jgi:hypothetical protein
MALLKRRPQWVESFRLQSRPGSGRAFLGVLFWIWGVGGLILNGMSLGGLSGSVGVGTSSYLAAVNLFWIGGMLLFGIGALLANGDFSAVKQEEPNDVGDVRITR